MLKSSLMVYSIMKAYMLFGGLSGAIHVKSITEVLG